MQVCRLSAGCAGKEFCILLGWCVQDETQVAWEHDQHQPAAPLFIGDPDEDEDPLD
jgi:hypothetical protein